MLVDKSNFWCRNNNFYIQIYINSYILYFEIINQELLKKLNISRMFVYS